MSQIQLYQQVQNTPRVTEEAEVKFSDYNSLNEKRKKKIETIINKLSSEHGFTISHSYSTPRNNGKLRYIIHLNGDDVIAFGYSTEKIFKITTAEENEPFTIALCINQTCQVFNTTTKQYDLNYMLTHNPPSCKSWKITIEKEGSPFITLQNKQFNYCYCFCFPICYCLLFLKHQNDRTFSLIEKAEKEQEIGRATLTSTNNKIDLELNFEQQLASEKHIPAFLIALSYLRQNMSHS